jgi:hypothetical protein
MQNKSKLLEELTKHSLESQNQKLRLLAKVDLDTKLKIFQYQKPLFHKLKSTHSDVDHTVLTLSSLILAVDAVVKELNSISLNAIKIRGKNNKCKAKRQKLLGYWAIVGTLKYEQNMSFRQIADYFNKYHKLEVSHSTIYVMWREIEQKPENKEN